MNVDAHLPSDLWSLCICSGRQRRCPALASKCKYVQQTMQEQAKSSQLSALFGHKNVKAMEGIRFGTNRIKLFPDRGILVFAFLAFLHKLYSLCLVCLRVLT